MSMRTVGLLAAILAAVPALAIGQTPEPAVPVAPVASGSPVAVTDPFVIPWRFDAMLACMTFSNASDKVIKAVRFGLSSAQQNPLGNVPNVAIFDRIGSFAPGVAIRPPAKFLGTVNRESPALANCWETGVSNIKTELQITVLKVVYADDTVWINPQPEPIASVTY